MSNTHVLVAIPSTGEIPFKSLQSFVGMAASHKYRQTYNFNQTLIHRARNQAVVTAVEYGCTHLMFIDDDMTFPAHAVDQLVEADKDIIGGLCYARKELQENKPIIKRIENNVIVDMGVEDVPTFDEPFKVDLTGTGFLLINMRVFQTLEPPFFYYANPEDYGMKKLPFPEDDLSEDITFMLNARKAGFETWIDPRLEIGHVGTKIYKKEENPMIGMPPPGKTAIFIPTVKRPHLIGPLIDNIRANTPEEHTIYIMTNDKKTMEIAVEKNVEIIDDSHEEDHRYNTRINHLFNMTDEPFIFTCADDVIFHKGWLTEAKKFLGAGAKVVAVNDRLNKEGTMFLIDRTYIDEHSGCMDEPGVIFHTGYFHNFVDTELIAVSRKRKVFAKAELSIVEHNHYLNHKRSLDESDLWAQQHIKKDQQRFLSRRRLWQ